MQPVKETVRQNNEPIRFTSEFQMYSNNSVPLTNNTFHPPIAPTLHLSGQNDKTEPEATASISQQCETNSDAEVSLSVEESGKNTRIIYKEKDVDLIQLSHDQKPTPTGNIQKACLVHFREQYHLDTHLQLQPKATKYFVKVRTEISPGRFMAKLELRCSR